MSPSDLPSTGHRFLTTWKFMRDPYGCYRDWKNRYGNTFVVNALNGDVVVSCDRENIRRAFAASFDEVAPFAVGTVAPLIGKSSVFVIQGEEHRRERSILSPPFHGQAMRNKTTEVQEIALGIARGWKPNSEVRIMDSALEVSLEVIIRIVFGVQSNDLVEQFKCQIKKYVKSFRPLLAFTRLFQRSMFGLSPWNNFVFQRGKLLALLMDQIKLRRENGGNEGSILTQLIDSTYEDGKQANDSAICDQLVSILLAGHETTQIAIAWAMSWLHRHPEIATRLFDELGVASSIDEVLDNELLAGICNESLRLNAIVPDVVRTLVKPMSFTDVKLPAGTNISIPICMIHEDPDLYPDPFEFQPDRWIGRSFKPHEFLPFGGGVRRCIGAPLALMEMKVVVGVWMRHYKFELPQDVPANEPVHRRNFTMAPKTGIPLIFCGSRNSG